MALITWHTLWRTCLNGSKSERMCVHVYKTKRIELVCLTKTRIGKRILWESSKDE